MANTLLTAGGMWQALEPGLGGAGSSVELAGITIDGVPLTPEAQIWRTETIAEANPWVLAAWLARTRPVSLAPLHVFRRTGETRVRVRRSDSDRAAPLARSLERTADGDRLTSSMRWLALTMRDKLLHGDAYSEILLNGAVFTGLRRHPAGTVVPVKIDGALQGYRIGDRTIDRAQVLHLRDHESDDGETGRSPLASLQATNELHDLATKYASAYMRNGSFPSGYVEVDPQHATADQLKITRQIITAAHSGVRNAGNAMVGYGKWHQISATPDGAKLVELSRASREEVAAAFSVPMSIIGDARDTNKATAQADWDRFLRFVVGHDVQQTVAELETQVVDRRFPDGIEVEQQMGKLLQPDMEAMAKIVQAEVGAPVATPNEGRHWVGLSPLDDPRADQLVVAPGTEDPFSDDGDDTDPDDE